MSNVVKISESRQTVAIDDVHDERIELSLDDKGNLLFASHVKGGPVHTRVLSPELVEKIATFVKDRKWPDSAQ